jgi:hypothetical protein
MVSIRVKFGNSRTSENSLSSYIEGDFAHFKIAATAEVRDVAILFYCKILDQLRLSGPVWVQVQSRWGRKKDLALAAREPVAAFRDSLFFVVESKQELEDFLYRFWHRGPLRFCVWRSITDAEKSRIAQSLQKWRIQEFYVFFPRGV